MLNDTAYVLLAGDPSKWDQETIDRCRPGGSFDGRTTFNSDDLCSVQVDQHRRGRRSARLTESIYGWYVRAASNLDVPQILQSTVTGRTRGCLSGSIEDAVNWGVAWANDDPSNREFFASRSDLEADRNTADHTFGQALLAKLKDL